MLTFVILKTFFANKNQLTNQLKDLLYLFYKETFHTILIMCINADPFQLTKYLSISMILKKFIFKSVEEKNNIYKINVIGKHFTKYKFYLLKLMRNVKIFIYIFR